MGFDRCRLAYIFARSLISRLHLTDWRLVEIQFFFSSVFFLFSEDGNSRVGKDIKRKYTAKKNWNARTQEEEKKKRTTTNIAHTK
jgi:hypothetical protein